MHKKELLYEGKAKKVYATEDPDAVIVSYKDDATALDGLKRGSITGKGVINNQMTNHLMRKLSAAGIPTHYLKELNERETAVRKVDIVPLGIAGLNEAGQIETLFLFLSVDRSMAGNRRKRYFG